MSFYKKIKQKKKNNKLLYQPFLRYISTYIPFWSMLALSYVSHETMQIGAKPKHAKTAGVLTQIGLTTYSRTILHWWRGDGFFFFFQKVESVICYTWNKTFPLFRTIHMHPPRYCDEEDMEKCKDSVRRRRNWDSGFRKPGIHTVSHWM